MMGAETARGSDRSKENRRVPRRVLLRVLLMAH